jgi:dihydrofolate reductase
VTISIIVAASKNNVIGSAGGLPWRLPEELQRFKQITMGKPMIMGRTTWESIGRPLPGRQNIIMTRQADFAAAGCDVAASMEDALSLAGDAEEIMVIGGGNIYAQFLPLTDRVYLTCVDVTIDGDTVFPSLDDSEWQQVNREAWPAAADRQYPFEILTLDRKR